MGAVGKIPLGLHHLNTKYIEVILYGGYTKTTKMTHFPTLPVNRKILIHAFFNLLSQFDRKIDGQTDILNRLRILWPLITFC